MENSRDPEKTKVSSLRSVIVVLTSAVLFVVFSLLFLEITGHLPRGCGRSYYGPGWWEFYLVIIPSVSGGILVKFIIEKVTSGKS
jgi:hypothetical protein